MIEALISSKTRIKLLLKFFINGKTKAYLRGLQSEFGESTNSIRIELNRFEKAGMLISSQDGNKKIFQANTKHPLYNEIHNIVLKHIGIDKVIENVVHRLGDVKQVYLEGDFAKGINSNIIDLIFIGKVDQNYLIELTGKVEEIISKKIRYIIYTDDEFSNIDYKLNEPLLLWAK